jgi:uncharacterized protein (DUF983 family)
MEDEHDKREIAPLPDHRRYVAIAQCPDCGTTQPASGFSELTAFVCKQCGETFRLKDDPSIDPFFGKTQANIRRTRALESLACVAALFR